MQFHHITLENGLEIIGETNPAAQSTAIGFFVKTGARDETSDVAGVSHFLEHMAFKGDEKYSAEDVNRLFDEVGASYNASTSEELTFYYAAILPEYLEQTFELLARMMRPSLREDDFHTEKQVIIEEIGMYDDMPAFYVYEQAMGLHFAGHPLGQSVLGSTDSITALTARQMQMYHHSRYGAGNLVLAATGNMDWEFLTALARKYCGSWQMGHPGRVQDEAHPAGAERWVSRNQMHQQHVMQMAPAPMAQDALRLAAEIVGTIVGDDGTGRLHWELVETGLAESADLAYNCFDGSGIWATYLCGQPEETFSNLERIRTIYEQFNESGPTDEELTRARNKVASRVVLASERPMGRLSSLGENWLYRQEYRSVAADLETLKQIDQTMIRQLLKRYPLGQTTTVGLGPLVRKDGPAA